MNAFVFPEAEIGDFCSFIAEIGDIGKLFFFLLRLECSVRVTPRNEALRTLRNALLKALPFQPGGPPTCLMRCRIVLK
jgi:hypothetical protein